ncbi:ADP-ribose pyrophosphatase YjhB, NUDIX family [Halovenus aranensis]|uniref:ADP-ribose pyrophosphatase YjhB, NUDIX family n=1 Tax=Halovenus aranensis TaxID=890420 RepID=A0A1G8ZKF7_9EURY|nr:NUDIX hydrolase [Halovenus aranensis]SDK15612.1 ADP-ribose pyrophosphatase YjhB, NUDIX family [Halovenus aranensis]
MSEIQYCPHCGTALKQREIEGRRRYYCISCERTIYRNPKPCAGVLVVDGNKVLVVKRGKPPAVGAWSLPAGYLEVDENPKEAAVRELREETNLSISKSDIELFTTHFVSNSGNHNVLVLIYKTRYDLTDGLPLAGSDALDVCFFDPYDSQDLQIESGYLPIFQQAVESNQSTGLNQ